MVQYYKYSKYLKDKYGVKTYKIPINLALTCPNRDGNLGYKGCAYCGEDGASFSKTEKIDLKKEIIRMKKGIAKKYKAEKFIVYFQNFTNTYLPLKELEKNLKTALAVDDVVEIALATRPDCINQKYIKRIMEVISKNKPEVNIVFELGLQSPNYQTLENINRGHSLAEFIDAVLTAQKFGAEIGVHLILNLPGDKKIDAREAAKLVSALGVDNVKLHALYIREDTVLGTKYKKGEFEMISLAEYIDRTIEFLEYLDPQIAVQRLLGKAPQEGSLFVNWGYNYSKVNKFILAEMEKRGSFQGKQFNYLQGKALSEFC